MEQSKLLHPMVKFFADLENKNPQFQPLMLMLLLQIENKSMNIIT